MTQTEKFELIDSSRGRYIIHKGGEIERTDQKFTPSGQWLMMGLAHRNGFQFGKLAVRFENITPEWLAANPLLFKNGSPRYTVCDIDHGTTRVWGNRAGVSSIRFL